MAMRHGSTCFRVSVSEKVRATRSQADLSPTEVEAVLYYLLNIERIQDAERTAGKAA